MYETTSSISQTPYLAVLAENFEEISLLPNRSHNVDEFTYLLAESHLVVSLFYQLPNFLTKIHLLQNCWVTMC